MSLYYSDHPSVYQDEPTKPVDLLRDDAMIRKIPTWLHNALQNVERHAIAGGDFQKDLQDQACSFDWNQEGHNFADLERVMDYIQCP